MRKISFDFSILMISIKQQTYAQIWTAYTEIENNIILIKILFSPMTSLCWRHQFETICSKGATRGG